MTESSERIKAPHCQGEKTPRYQPSPRDLDVVEDRSTQCPSSITTDLLHLELLIPLPSALSGLGQGEGSMSSSPPTPSVPKLGQRVGSHQACRRPRLLRAGWASRPCHWRESGRKKKPVLLQPSLTRKSW